MKFLLSAFTLLLIVLCHPAYAEKEPAKKSFGDKSHKYKSHYQKPQKQLRKKIRALKAKVSEDISRPESRKPDSSEEMSEDGGHSSH